MVALAVEIPSCRKTEADEFHRAVKTRPRGYILDYHPQQATVQLLAAAVAVLNAFRQYWPLTARQIFYRLVGAHGYPKTDAFYEKLCHHLANARRARRIPFDTMRDDGVSVIASDCYASMDAFHERVRDMASRYERDLMADQSVAMEVWCEAAGMQPQLAKTAGRYSIPVYSCGGFDSLTAKKDIAERVCASGKRTIILHLGDLDPSGESIFTSAAEDVAAFVRADRPGPWCSVEFRRVALTAAQVREYELPTAPAKTSDSRSKTWRGETCQLEALTPDQIAELLNQAIRERLDLAVAQAALAEEEKERRLLLRALPAAPWEAAE